MTDDQERKTKVQSERRFKATKKKEKKKNLVNLFPSGFIHQVHHYICVIVSFVSNEA